MITAILNYQGFTKKIKLKDPLPKICIPIFQQFEIKDLVSDELKLSPMMYFSLKKKLAPKTFLYTFSAFSKQFVE